MNPESDPLNGEKLICIEEANVRLNYYLNKNAIKTKAKSLFLKYCLAMSCVVILFLLAIIFYFIGMPFFKDKIYNESEKSRKVENINFCCLNVQKEGICQFRIHRSTMKCYKVGSRGPCNKNMIFHLEDPSSVYGQCGCDYENHNRSLILDTNGQNCFFVFEQGSCPDGKWITLSYMEDNLSLNPIASCEDSLCKLESGKKLVPLLVKTPNGEETLECVELHEFSQYCPYSSINYTIEFTPDSLYPECVHISQHVELESQEPRSERLTWYKSQQYATTTKSAIDQREKFSVVAPGASTTLDYNIEKIKRRKGKRAANPEFRLG